MGNKLFICIFLIVTLMISGCTTSEQGESDATDSEEVIESTEQMVITEEIDELISSYIVNKYSTTYSDTEVQFEVHKIYGASESNGILTVYMWSYYGGFNKSTGTEIQSGHSLPAVIRLRKDSEKYNVIEYVEPRDGSQYLPSLKKIFPEKYLKIMQQESGNIAELQAAMDEKVKEWLNT